jgi:hypothetical protein
MDVDDIEIAADWRLNPGVLIPCLVELRLLDQLKSGYRVHDWEELQPWAYSSPERVEKAREKAKKRWDKRNELEAIENKPEKSMQTASITHAQCNAPSPVPSPVPVPSPTPTYTTAKKRRKRINTEYTSAFLGWWKNVWLPHEAHRSGAGPGAKAEGFKAWLEEGCEDEPMMDIAGFNYLEDAHATGSMTKHASSWIRSRAFEEWRERAPRDTQAKFETELDRRVRVQREEKTKGALYDSGRSIANGADTRRVLSLADYSDQKRGEFHGRTQGLLGAGGEGSDTAGSEE